MKKRKLEISLILFKTVMPIIQFLHVPIALFAVPPMPVWVKPLDNADYSRAPTGKSTDYQKNVMADNKKFAVSGDSSYRPSCAYFLGCPSSKRKEYENWPEAYLRKTDDQMSIFVKDGQKMARLRAVEKKIKQ